jgi:hypothetical protein
MHCFVTLPRKLLRSCFAENQCNHPHYNLKNPGHSEVFLKLTFITQLRKQKQNNAF